MPKYLNTKEGSLESAVLEAVSRAQQAAIAISKKEKEEESVQEKYTAKQYKMAFGVLNDPRWKGGNMTKIVDTIEKIAKGLSKDKAVAHAIQVTNEALEEGSKEEYEKFFNSALKKFGIESPADLKSDEEKKKFFDYVDKNYKSENEESEQVNEKVEYVEYKFRNRRDAEKANEYFRAINIMSLEINDDGIENGDLAVDAGNKDMTKYHKEVMKKFKPKVVAQEDATTKEVKEGLDARTKEYKEHQLKLEKMRARREEWKKAAKKTESIKKEEVELDEVSNPFELYQTVKGWEKASAEMVKELEKAKKMSDKNKARDHMYKVQKKFSKFGAQDTEANTEIRHALGMNEESSLVNRAAEHIANMWKESAGVDKSAKKEDNHKDDEEGKQTMTGKPVSKVEVSPADKVGTK